MRFPRQFPLVLAILATLVGCSGGRGGRDVRLSKTVDEGAPDAGAIAPIATTTVSSVSTGAPVTKGARPRVLAHAYAAAITTTKTHLYYSDADDDTIFALPKNDGGEAVRVAQRAPVRGALVADDTALTWIASPGDVVFRLPFGATQPSVIREREIFTDVAAQGGEVFLIGAEKGGGSLMRITGPTAARLATFDAVPRTVLADATSVFVVTTTSVLRTTKKRGEVVTIATGTGFGAAAMDEVNVYVTMRRGSSRAILRVPKYGAATTVASTIDGVRDAPIAVLGGEIFFFDEAKPALVAHAIATNATRVVSEDPIFEHVNALEVDADGAWAATGEASYGLVVRVPVR